ncbi:MAG: glycosyltransferase family 4 protein [Candidatus Poribacteria bacterium]|nr:glycosyltransferase family 4 protein [Candidatus Poribacteria bacterium]
MIPILYLSHCGSSIGGGERQLFYLVTHLNKNLYQPIVVCPDGGIFAEQLREANIPIAILNLPPWRKIVSRLTRHTAAAKLTDLAKEHNIQLMHTSDSWLNPYLLPVKNQLNVSVISHVRNLLTPAQVSKYAFDQMSHIITISKQSKAPLVQAGISSEKIDVILNCVDLSVFQPNPIVRDKNTDPFIVGIVGRIEPFKKQKTFVKIAHHVIQQCQNVRFYIIGAALDTPEHRTYDKEIHQLVSQYKLEEMIHFTGHRNDMPRVMQELDILVTLSAGSVIAEAMASGKPVIGTPIGSTSEMIVDSVTGWVIPLDSIEAISDKIVQLVKNPTHCVQMGAAARKHAEAVFSVEKHVQRIQDIYEKLIETNNENGV